MAVRAYILLDIVNGKSNYAARMLRSRSGVVIADTLEGRPDVIAIVEAPNRQKLAEAIMPVIGCIGDITEDLHLLVTRDSEPLPVLFASRDLRPHNGENEKKPASGRRNSAMTNAERRRK